MDGKTSDVAFFSEHPDRQCRLRKPVGDENQHEFITLGFHLPERRRILVWKVPKGSAFGEGRILQMPFLKFADETIADNDETLLPILHEIMTDAAKEYGMPAPRIGKKHAS